MALITSNRSVTFSEMDNDVAKRLVNDGGTLVFVNVPIGTEFGIDTNVFNVGDRFKGVKMIPPGLHFVFYSAVSKENTVAPRTGFFHWFKSGEIVVKKWNKFNEDIEDEPVSENELERFRANLKGDLDRFLGVYPYENWRGWVSLTNFVTEELIGRVQPINGKVSSVAQFVPCVYPPPAAIKAAAEPAADSPMEVDARRKPRLTLEQRLLPDMKLQPGTEMRFTPIPVQRYPPGATPSEMTRHSLDSTYILEQVLRTQSTANDILGELQLAFVCFLIGQLYDAFEHWKKLLDMLVTSDEALETRPQLFLDLITVLHFQIKEVPSDFFVDIVSAENFLTSTLSVFFENVASSQRTTGPLRIKSEKFRANLTKRLKWDFKQDDEEPIVVQMESEEIESESEQ